ncbi:MAG: alpha/beta fold hydrolase [Flavobacteriales bacterium]
MKNIIIIIIGVLLFFSCKKEQALDNLNETIYVRHQGADMAVYLRGNIASNVLVLVVHGGPGGNGLEYRTGPWTVDLEKKYCMAYWDQRGQGMSHGKFNKENMTIAQMVADMDAVIQTLKFKFGKDLKVFAYGHSWGGTITPKYMITGNLQQNVEGWITSNGAHDMPKNDIESVKLFLKTADEQITAGNSTDKWKEIKTWASGIDTNSITDAQSLEINKKAFEVEKWLFEDGVLNPIGEGGNSGGGIFSPINPLSSQLNGRLTNTLLSKEIQETSFTNQLFKVTIPTLVLAGKYDFVVAPELANDAFNLISSANKKLVVFNKSGHSPMSHEPTLYTQELISFIDTHK